MFQALKSLFSLHPPAELQQYLERMVRQTPTPRFWLVGKTQSGKTSVVRFLTGADNAEIGQGFKPCTRFSRVYDFPNAEAPLLEFLDTRGLEESDYDPTEDLAQFNDQAHVLIVTVRALDQSLGKLVEHLRPIRKAKPRRACILLLTTLHEAYPQQQHPLPYPFKAARPGHADIWNERQADAATAELRRALTAQLHRFEGLFDYAVPIDFTLPEEGFNEPYYGGALLREVLIEALPSAYRQTLIHLEEKSGELYDLYARQAQPYLLKSSALAAAAALVPVPWIDHLLVPGIQSSMVTQLAKLYGQPLESRRFVELMGGLGLGLGVQKALAATLPLPKKLATALAWAAATFALGKASCYYFASVRGGHVPGAEELGHYYDTSVRSAEEGWLKLHAAPARLTPERA